MVLEAKSAQADSQVLSLWPDRTPEGVRQAFPGPPSFRVGCPDLFLELIEAHVVIRQPFAHGPAGLRKGLGDQPSIRPRMGESYVVDIVPKPAISRHQPGGCKKGFKEVLREGASSDKTGVTPERLGD